MSYTLLLLQSWIDSGLGERLDLKVRSTANPALGELGKAEAKELRQRASRVCETF